MRIHNAVRAMVAVVLLPIVSVSAANGQTNSPPIVTRNIPYTANPHPRQNFDLYLPPGNHQQPPTLILWIHGGAWMLGSKEWINVRYLINHGYAIASVDYRFSGDAAFPTQIQDCNTALNFLMAHAASYGIASNRCIIGGGSAGGNLALLLGLARNEKAFGADPSIKPLAILDFFGPTDLTRVVDETVRTNEHATAQDAVQRLLGGPVADHLDLARLASPINYVSHDSAPVLILHGDKDEMVPVVQSQRLHARLDEAGVKNELITVKGAGHDGPMFETPDIQDKVVSFLQDSPHSIR
jgi:acetyl esterase/lipase